MDQQILDKAQYWASNSAFLPADQDEIKNLLNSLPQSEDELKERFFKDLEFGTGGLRAPIRIGQNGINIYTIRRATHALSQALLKHYQLPFSTVVSFDSRHFSKKFAEEVCAVFASYGIKAYLFRELTPTPMLSYAIRQLGAKGGVMVTASHNPPKYNGYKAYWSDGGQVVPPYDQEIINIYNSLTDWSQLKAIDFKEGLEKNLISYVANEVNENFYQMIQTQVIQDLTLCREQGKKLGIVFTPIHGSGLIPCKEIMLRLGFSSLQIVEAQAQPDPNFSTVKYPNPEDPEALKMAIDQMLLTSSDIVMGTDPDGDRLGVVVNDHGKPFFLTGNQIGALFLDYVFASKQKNKKLPPNPLVVRSIVTSSIQDAIVESYGGKVETTLTGFKWMAKLIKDFEDKNSSYNFVFASEESFGYMPHKESRDKDGVASVALMCEVALYHKQNGHNLREALDQLSEKYGYFDEALVSLDFEGIEGGKKIQRIMDHFRNWTQTSMVSEKIIQVDDYLKLKTKNYQTEKSEQIQSEKSNVLGFFFESGDKLYLRPSGTEPKIKFYIMTKAKESNLQAKKNISSKKIHSFKEFILKTCESL